MKELIAAINRANAQQKLSLLPQALKYGDSGIDFLIESLKDQELFVREKAYQLLGKVGSEKAKQAIASGLLLNPGDKIYSVYAASKWFTDTVYVLSNNVDYLTDIYSEVYGYLEKYGRNYYDEEELRQRSKRVFCCVNPEQAAQKAEFLHRQAIQKLRVGIGGFEWEQENPDFDIKQLYLAHNLPYQDEWNDLGEYSIRWKMESAVWESGDTTLRDQLKRGKYKYSPEHIETWFDEHNLEYDRNLDNWDNYDNLLNYLHLPENIELLSKFWKDGVGHFAFVREEFVKRQVYVRVGEDLNDQTGKIKITGRLIAKPKNYEQKASNFLIGILNNRNQKPQQRLKAYELLQNFETEAAKIALAQGITDITLDSVFDLGEKVELNPTKINWDEVPF